MLPSATTNDDSCASCGAMALACDPGLDGVEAGFCEVAVCGTSAAQRITNASRLTLSFFTADPLEDNALAHRFETQSKNQRGFVVGQGNTPHHFIRIKIE